MPLEFRECAREEIQEENLKENLKHEISKPRDVMDYTATGISLAKLDRTIIAKEERFRVAVGIPKGKREPLQTSHCSTVFVINKPDCEAEFMRRELPRRIKGNQDGRKIKVAKTISEVIAIVEGRPAAPVSLGTITKIVDNSEALCNPHLLDFYRAMKGGNEKEATALILLSIEDALIKYRPDLADRLTAETLEA